MVSLPPKTTYTFSLLWCVDQLQQDLLTEQTHGSFDSYPFQAGDGTGVCGKSSISSSCLEVLGSKPGWVGGGWANFDHGKAANGKELAVKLLFLSSCFASSETL